MYEKSKFLSMGYISSFDKCQCINIKQRMIVCCLKLQQKTPIIYLIQSGMKAQLVSYLPLGVTLAQLVKASVGQADVQRFEPHLGHN